MRSFSPNECVPLDVLLNREEMQNDISRLIEERVLDGDLIETGLVLDDPDIAEARLEAEEVEEEEDGVIQVSRPVADEYEEDPVTCYLREVSGYPLLSQEREIELALIIREGQEKLVGLVAEHQDLIPLQDLYGKIETLLSNESAFPGVRDKILKVILRSLARFQQEYPDEPIYSELLSRSQSYMDAIDSAKQEMVKANLRLVLSIAKRYRGRGMSFDDLIQEGNLGLLKAVGRFDHTKGNRFSTYATWWVRQSIIRGIYDKTRTIRLPVHFIELKNLFFKVFYELLKELGREPTPQEIADQAKLPLDKVQMVVTLAAQPVSLETPIGDDEQRLGDFIEDDRAASPMEEYSDKELAGVTRSLLAGLQPREEKILRLRFGLDGHSAETLEKIGKTFNVSKERIRQIEKKALRKLRNPNRQASLKTFMD
ncbi:MAG: RNA polymerase sigma factor RpoD/SigA [Syntrophobacteraceae bacterium]